MIDSDSPNRFQPLTFSIVPFLGGKNQFDDQFNGQPYHTDTISLHQEDRTPVRGKPIIMTRNMSSNKSYVLSSHMQRFLKLGLIELKLRLLENQKECNGVVFFLVLKLLFILETCLRIDSNTFWFLQVGGKNFSFSQALA